MNFFWVWIGIMFVGGFFMGVVLYYVLFSYAVKREIRRRLEYEKYNTKPVNMLSETRSEPRRPESFLLLTVRAPVLDSAGVAVVGEEFKYNAQIIDISRRGCGFLSNYFLPVGVDIYIGCYEKKLTFSFRQAEVKDVVLTAHGLRIGVQFFEPLTVL